MERKEIMAMHENEKECDLHIPSYIICRFMIDKDLQGRGIGRAVFAKVLEYLKTFPRGKADAILLSYMPENTVARSLYTSFGFRETGDMHDGEVIAMLKL